MEETKTSFVDSCHWSTSLKCDVCFDLFKEPHTLPCGHSFCTCCLKRLAQSARNHNQTMSLHKVKLHCPTCRQDSLAKPIIKEDISVSFALRDIVDGWKKEKERFSTNGCVSLRSVSSQTPTNDTKWPSYKIKSLVSRDEMHERLIPDDEYISKALRVTESEESIEEGLNIKTYSTCSETQQDSTENEIDSDWENFDDLDHEDVNHDQANQVQPGEGDDGFQIMWSPGRVAMTIFWFIYTAVVTFIAHGFFPYMILYTLLFVLILYTENLHRG